MMEKIYLFPRKPCPSWIWQKEAPFALVEKIDVKIRPVVADNGEVSYYLGDEWLQDGAYIVEVFRGMFVPMTPEEVDRRYVR